MICNTKTIKIKGACPSITNLFLIKNHPFFNLYPSRSKLLQTKPYAFAQNVIRMIVKIQNIKQLGAVAKHVRQGQSLDQETAGLLSGNGLTFISQF